MWEVSGANWPVLTRTNYGRWAVLMKVKLRAWKLWKAVKEGTEDEEDCSAMDTILSAVPHEYVESLGTLPRLPGTPSRLWGSGLTAQRS